jgi:lipopolysaccharide transport system ATP-binding protein
MKAIRVQNFGKHYRLGTAGRVDRNLTETLVETAKGLFSFLRSRSRNSTDFWALREVSFDVEPGEVVGIIGRNGAGKSTLLKLLSRITEPSTGRAEIRGRLGSLLEVGTGFHPELTGRENIYLNGSILGMSRFEIQKHFDEIVAFADLEKFLDTPVKRYSSGMYVRLAFAIAAHLQPEILILDEVLAVGDAQFQKKCLSKMKDVSRDGKTVLFVSHDLSAIRRLCKRAILLSQGRLIADGDTDSVAATYLNTEAQIVQPGQAIDLSQLPRRGTREVSFKAISLRGHPTDSSSPLRTQSPLVAELTLEADHERVVDGISLILFDRGGYKLINADTIRLEREWKLKSGENRLEFRLPSLPLQPGIYILGLWLARRPGTIYDYLEYACEVEVLPPLGDDKPRPVGDGVVACDFEVSDVIVDHG